MKYIVRKDRLTNIADAIRRKLNSTGKLSLSEMPSKIDSISSGGIDTSDATATANEIQEGKTAYINGTKVVGTLQIRNVYVGTTPPSDDMGNDGDLYLEVEE